MLQVDTVTQVQYDALVAEMKKEHSRNNRNEEHIAELMKVHVYTLTCAVYICSGKEEHINKNLNGTLIFI